MTLRQGRSGCRAASLALCLALTACAANVKVFEVTTPVKLERRKLVPDAPVYKGEWHVTRDAIQGRLTWQTCERHSTWRTTRMSVARSRKLGTLGAVLAGSATILTFAAAATYPEPEKRCDVFGCVYTDTDSDLTQTRLLAGTAAVLLVTGVVLMLTGGKTRIEKLDDIPGRLDSTGPCFSQRELADLLLVLRVNGRLWPVRLAPTGELAVLVPEASRIPEGVDMDLLVYRAPPGASELALARGTVLARLRLDSPPPPPSPPGTASFPSDTP